MIKGYLLQIHGLFPFCPWSVDALTASAALSPLYSQSPDGGGFAGGVELPRKNFYIPLKGGLLL